MTGWILLVVFVELLAVTVWGQRVAPGVPPQQYQPDHQQYQVPQQQYQQVPQQQYQQVPQHQQQQYQQVPQQHQQAPQQFQQQHQQQPPQQHFQQQQAPQHFQQQVPVQQHVQPGIQDHHPQQILTANIAQEKHHIAEHLDVPMDTSKMSEQELQFHYFKMHDADNNNKLDGCELIKSLIHWHAETENKEGSDGTPQTDEELANMIDPILKEMDSNNDGYVDYAEFKKAEG